MLDTDLHAKDEQPGSGGDLDADRFFHDFAVPPRTPGALEGALCAGATPEEIYFVNDDVALGTPEGDYVYLVMKSSRDAGRTWSDAWEMRDRAGRRIKGSHQTVVRAQGGKLALVYNDHTRFPSGHPGRDGGSGMMFRESEDEGRTWSEPVLVYPFHALCCSGHALVLSTGRIVVPAFRWISNDPTGESESFKAPTRVRRGSRD